MGELQKSGDVNTTHTYWKKHQFFLDFVFMLFCYYFTYFYFVIITFAIFILLSQSKNNAK